MPACAQRNIKVIPATGANAESVAEYVIGTALALTRGFMPATVQTLDGKWPRPHFSGYHEFTGKTLGIVGFGSIGRVTAQKALAFGLKCLAYDPMLSGKSITAEPSFDSSMFNSSCFLSSVLMKFSD